MKTYTLKLSKDEIVQIKKAFAVFQVRTNNPNLDFCFKYENVTISIYRSGSILFQGNYVDKVVKFVLAKHDESKSIPEVNEKPNTPFKKKDYKPLFSMEVNEIGCDEVGVGDYFGGMVMCAAYLNENQKKDLQKIGVQDSKKLNDQQISTIAIKLLDQLQITYAVSNYIALEYNNLYDKYQNSHILKTLGHNQALTKLLNANSNIKLTNTRIIMDQYVSKQHYYNYLAKINVTNPVRINTFETKADSKYLSVAAASIIARYVWLNEIDKMSKKYQIPIFLGASNPKILAIAKKIYQDYGINELKKCVKLHFNFTDKITVK